MNKGLTITAIAAAAIAGYAVYFDYQRRNSADFRKSLKKREVKQKKLKAKRKPNPNKINWKQSKRPYWKI